MTDEQEQLELEPDEPLELELPPDDLADELLEAAKRDDAERIAALERLARELEAQELGDKIAANYCVTGDQLLDTAELEPPWLVPGAVPLGGLTFFAGVPEAAKSWLAYDLAVSVLTGKPWLGFPLAPVTRRVLVLNYDNPSGELARRMRLLGLPRGSDILFHSFGLHKIDEPWPSVLTLPVAEPALRQLVYSFRPTLILVDSLRQAHDLKEESSSDMALVMRQLKGLYSYGAAVVCIHHLRKPGGDTRQKPTTIQDDIDAMRGSTEIRAAADAIVLVKDSIAYWAKTRGWVMAEREHPFTLTDAGAGQDKRVHVQVLEAELLRLLQAGPYTRDAIAVALNITAAQAKAVVDRAIIRDRVREGARVDGARPVELATRLEPCV